MRDQAARTITTRLIAVIGLSLAISLVAFLAWGLSQPPGAARAFDDWWCDVYPADCYTPEPTATHTATAVPTPAPTGSLRASRSSILVGQYVTVSSYNVNSSAAPTSFDIAGPVSQSGYCPAGASGEQAQADERREVSGAGSTVSLRGCSAGTATVWLVSRTGIDLDEISISIRNRTSTPDHTATAEAEETAAAETAVVETAAAETAVVETAVAETAVAETAVAETAVAETATAEAEETATAVALEATQTAVALKATQTAVALKATQTAVALKATQTAVALKATQTAVAETAVAETAVAETAVAETAVAETAVAETAVAETAVAETAVVETAIAETAVAATATAVARAIDPLAAPRWVGYTEEGYRSVKLDWTADPDSADFSIEWSDDQTGWAKLRVGGSSGPRVAINSATTTAVVRGLPQNPGNLYFKIIASADDGRTATSPVGVVARQPSPQVIGHQHDHTASYTLSMLGAGTVDAMMKGSARFAAGEWSNHSSVSAYGVRICEDPCSANSDGHVFTVKLSSGSGAPGNDACGVSVACVISVFADKYQVSPPPVEHHLTAGELVIEEPPRGGIGANNSHRRFRWTRNAALDATTAPSGEIWRFIDPIMVHEFGHILGLPDFKPHETHLGVMKDYGTYPTVTSADADVVKKIYANHAANRGW